MAVKTVRKVCGCLLRRGSSGPQLLVFEHPDAGVQLPKGGLEPDEDPETGVLRELLEETGLHGLEVTYHLGTWERRTGAGPDEAGPLERHLWDVFLLRSTDALPDVWLHEAWGSPEEEGLVFRCPWLPLDQDTASALHPLFGPVIDLLLENVDGFV